MHDQLWAPWRLAYVSGDHVAGDKPPERPQPKLTLPGARRGRTERGVSARARMLPRADARASSGRARTRLARNVLTTSRVENGLRKHLPEAR